MTGSSQASLWYNITANNYVHIIGSYLPGLLAGAHFRRAWEGERMNSRQPSKEVIVAVDPGREKCGVAVVASDLELILKEIVSRDEAVNRVLELAEKHGARKVVLGDRTGSRGFASEIQQEHPPFEIIFIDEHRSSMEGRRRYLLDHPLPGLGRLIPLSLRAPKEPFDDYVAVVLAERYFQRVKR